MAGRKTKDETSRYNSRKIIPSKGEGCLGLKIADFELFTSYVGYFIIK